jgi:hypothetical protein
VAIPAGVGKLATLTASFHQSTMRKGTSTIKKLLLYVKRGAAAKYLIRSWNSSVGEVGSDELFWLD